MNSLILTVLSGTVVALAAGVVLGLFRGAGRSLLRLTLLVLCIVLAFTLRGSLTDMLMGLSLGNGQTLEELLLAGLPEQSEGIRSIILPTVTILSGILSFLVLFCALLLLSWILVYPLLKLLLRPLIGRTPRHRGFGMLIGLLCGAAVAFAIFVPVNGLLKEAGKLASLNFSQPGTEEPDALTGMVGSFEAKDLEAYADSGISDFYSAVGDPFWQGLTTLTDRDGNRTVLSAQTDALSAAADFAVRISSLGELRNGDGSLNTDTVRAFAEALTGLDSLTPEAKAAFGTMLADMTESMGDAVPEALKGIDFANTDLRAEGELLIAVADCQESGSTAAVDMADLIDGLAGSTVILPLLSGSDVTVPLDTEKKAEADAAIARLEEKTGDDAVDAETLAQLRALFDSNG